MKYSGDYTWLEFVDGNMQLAAGGNNDFLDGSSALASLTGRWNDDIGWWALGTMTATEAFGTTGIVASHNIQVGFNPAYITLANNTFYEIYMNWDSTTCNGGIFWSRDRTSGSASSKLKSTITNVEEMELAARLHVVTGGGDYKEKFDLIYSWLKSSGLISADYTVYDSLEIIQCIPSYNEVENCWLHYL
ncbi:hydrolase 76 protein [Physocladia obscura]|uniref:mannan endo-1,6-alpha-mannosidase n=1 Tax=Physocladia obscura TaxID=109957 RepID=A0AAD5XE34_9FUNG|nr:hydrolase 76 protein [Physocladia obscura]